MTGLEQHQAPAAAAPKGAALLEVENLVKHFPVLSRYANDRFKSLLMFLEFLYKRRHLYSFRSRSKNKHYFLFCHEVRFGDSLLKALKLFKNYF